ncbi:MAG TPA: hypothetical protein VFS43_17010 [Polyangiaceae bacterium]|nr:hypothetical protein [Polyangiaceae bacterium]
METLFVRLRPFDPRRRQTLRRYTYRGIVFAEDRGWCRVEADVAAYLRGVRQAPDDPHAPAAFDVCTEEEARRLDAEDEAGSRRRVTSDDPVPFVRARDAGALASGDLPKGSPPKGPEPKADAKPEGAESKRGRG